MREIKFRVWEENIKQMFYNVGIVNADGICISNDEYAPPIIYFDSGEKARQALEESE